jgi:heme-degrading monooxygenase HmoA
MPGRSAWSPSLLVNVASTALETTRGADGFGITVSYWRDEASIAGWKADLEHREAQRKGRHGYYERFELRVARVERQKSFRLG